MTSKEFTSSKETRARYDQDYFERGAVLGISGYMNYRWMPELTLRMAHHIIRQLPIKADDLVLDYGCAKGFLVHALRILDIQAFGVDISDYAMSELPHEVKSFCTKIDRPSDIATLPSEFDWLISKDVFEHLSEEELRELLLSCQGKVRNIFAVIPLGHKDGSGFVIPQYDLDVTHITAQPADWWRALFESEGFEVVQETRAFMGVKENWVSAHPEGNAFYILRNRQMDG